MKQSVYVETSVVNYLTARPSQAANGVDYLVTWNCTHLANAVLRRQIEGLLEETGYECPVICTPDELPEE